MKWPCTVQECCRPALWTLLGLCEQCHRHFCGQHAVSALHTCLTTEEIHTIYMSGDKSGLRKLNTSRRTAGENIISALIDSIDSNALRERAETLRGIQCTVSLPAANQAYSNMDVVGGRNYHGSIVFENGEVWLARFRLPNHNAPPVEERNFDRRSEFATYRFLAEAAVPVPHVYDYADDEDPSNAVGAGYILVEKLAGKPLSWHEANQAQREKFMRQLADIYTKLEKHPLRAIGRLQPPSSSSVGQPVVGPAFFDYDPSGHVVPFGPFDNTDDYYKALIQHKIGLVKTGEIAPSAPLDQYLVYRSLLDRLPQSEQRPFFLRHVDSRDVNFLVDPDYNITGMIDLELAIITAKGAAFQSPILLYNLGELYHEGLSTPSEDEKCLAKILQEETESDELSALVAQKLHFRVDQVIETNPEDGKNFIRVFSGWWKAATGEQEFDWDRWYRNALDEYGDGGFMSLTIQ